MKKYILFFAYLCASLLCRAEMVPNPDAEPSGTLPIFYIETVNHNPIDQKETYIDAVAWLDASMTDEYESIGSEDKPLVLGIRGRGNSTWKAEGPKPYKLKFDKKQPFFGLTKNKHWVLLSVTTSYDIYTNLLGYKMAEQLGMKYQPKRFPVEVVLNGTYVGLYFFSENVRIDEGRVDIIEQPDLNRDDATIPYGWLVEIDNYEDDAQIRIPDPTAPDNRNSDIKITYSTPEVLSDVQEQWLFEQFDGFAKAAYGTNKLDREWEKYVNMADFVKFNIVQEALHNRDAYVGSCKLYKGNEESWHFGPLWDMNYSVSEYKSSMLWEISNHNQKYINAIGRYPRFIKEVNRYFSKYFTNYGTEWIRPFLDSVYVSLQPAMQASQNAWPEYTHIDVGPANPATFMSYNIYYVQMRLNTDLRTYDLTIETTIDDTPNEEYPGDEFPDEEYPDQPTDDEPTDDEPTDDELTDDEPSEDEPAEDEPADDEPSEDEPSEDEPTEDEPTDDEGPDSYVLVDGLPVSDPTVFKGQSVTLTFVTQADRKVESVYVNDVDMTEQIYDNTLTIKNITGNLHIRVAFGKRYSSVMTPIAHDTPRISVDNRTITINGDRNTPTYIYDISGRPIFHSPTSDNITFTVTTPGLYILRTGSTTQKILLP